MTLVNHIREEETIAHNGTARVQGWLNHLGDQFGTARHEQKRLAFDSQLMAVTEEQFAQFLAHRGASRIDALHHFQTAQSKPIR
jgi:hypothetical protein